MAGAGDPPVSTGSCYDSRTSGNTSDSSEDKQMEKDGIQKALSYGLTQNLINFEGFSRNLVSSELEMFKVNAQHQIYPAKRTGPVSGLGLPSVPGPGMIAFVDLNKAEVNRLILRRQIFCSNPTYCIGLKSLTNFGASEQDNTAPSESVFRRAPGTQAALGSGFSQSPVLMPPDAGTLKEQHLEWG
ncbi:hypothetical protein E5288_WYG012075 [Bos mutus]|uniref:Uncharacterized protein n=1 Tax=Bos mutus TaxID=72004 RepID=A0A6B0R6N3_9CETA|nr:hypothetical protein [Bos mutus]